mgnify:CR=1 FL=1
MRIYIGTRGTGSTPRLGPTGLFRSFGRLAVRARVKICRLANIGGNTRTARGARSFGAGLAGGVLRAGRSIGRLAGGVTEKYRDRALSLHEPLSHTVTAVKAHSWGLPLRLREHVSAFFSTRSRTVPCLFLATFTILIFSFSYFGVGLEVTVNGQSIGYVETRAEMEALVDEVEATATEYLGTPYHLSSEITYSLGYIHRDSMMDPDAAREMLLSDVSGISTQYVLTVDGSVVGATNNKTSLELLRQRLLKDGTGTGDNVKTEFVQDVRIEERAVPNSAIRSVEEIEQALTANSQEVVTYTVQDGDTVSAIAQRFSMKVADIESLNPDLNVSRIHVGDTLNISAAVPVLSIQQTRRVEYTEAIPFETVTEKTDDLYTNQSRIIQKGVEGSAAIVADVVYVDGVEQSRTILSSTVVTQPQTQIKEVGTKALPAKAPKGTFVLPFNGRRTSLYGWRRSGFHTGLDLAGAVGSPIVAADGGTVTLAGWNGGYGKCVIIDHGNGYQTLYAHCSALLVKEGQKVAQGEQIARVGSTGNSTGPHCHWEIRIGGKTVNPANYIGKSYY